MTLSLWTRPALAEVATMLEGGSARLEGWPVRDTLSGQLLGRNVRLIGKRNWGFDLSGEPVLWEDYIELAMEVSLPGSFEIRHYRCSRITREPKLQIARTGCASNDLIFCSSNEAWFRMLLEQPAICELIGQIFRPGPGWLIGGRFVMLGRGGNHIPARLLWPCTLARRFDWYKRRWMRPEVIWPMLEQMSSLATRLEAPNLG